MFVELCLSFEAPLVFDVAARVEVEGGRCERPAVRSAGDSSGDHAVAREHGVLLAHERCAARAAPSSHDASRSSVGRLAQHGEGLLRQLPPQARGDRVDRQHRAGRVVVAVDVDAERAADGRVEARVVDLVEEVLERAGHVAEVGRRAEEVAVGLEHVDRGRGERGARHHVDALDAIVRRAVRTASNIECSDGDGVWWTISNLRAIGRNSTHRAPAAVTVRRVARDRGWGFVLASTGIGSFVTSANLSTVNVAFPDIRASFPDESLASLGWVINAYTIAFAAVLLPAGRLADSHGRRRMFFAGLTLFAVGSLVTGAAPSLAVVILGRTVQGIGAALIAPASLGLLLEASPPDEITRSVALYGGITAVGVATGPTLGALIVDSVGWRWSFLLSLPFVFVAWFVGRNHLSRARGARPRASRRGRCRVGLPSRWRRCRWRSRREATGAGRARARSRRSRWASRRACGSSCAANAIRRQCFRWNCFECARSRFPPVRTVLFGVGTGAFLLSNVLFLTGVWHYSIVRAGLAMAPSPVVAAWPRRSLAASARASESARSASPARSILASAVLWYWFTRRLSSRTTGPTGSRPRSCPGSAST